MIFRSICRCILLLSTVTASCNNDPLCPEGLTWCWAQCLDLSNDDENCGKCENQCGPHSNCQNGECTCVDGYSDCGGKCVNLMFDQENCGVCGNVCECPCVNGSCIGYCPYIVCDCECVNPETDHSNCGACGNACGAHQTCCDGECVDTLTDDNNCGTCGNACALGMPCIAGECHCDGDLDGDGHDNVYCPGGDDCDDNDDTVYPGAEEICDGKDNDCNNEIDEDPLGIICSDWLTCCDGECVDLQTDKKNCGDCYMACDTSNGFSCCSGVCEDLLNDHDNCGECSRNCGDGQCLGSGICEPVALYEYPELNSPYYLAQDSSRIFWSHWFYDLQFGTWDGQILSMSKDGSIYNFIRGGLDEPMHVAVDDTHVYWTNSAGGTVVKIQKDGLGYIVLADSQASPFGIAVDDSFVYWTDNIGGEVRRVQKEGGSWETVATSSNPLDLAVDDTYVYWSDTVDGTVAMATKDGSAAPTVKASGLDSPADICIDEHDIYFLARGTSANSYMDGKVHQIQKYSNTLLTIASDQKQVFGISVDDSHVYWGVYGSGSLDGAIMKGIKGGGADPVALAMGEVTAAGTEIYSLVVIAPTDIVVDETSVYWTQFWHGLVLKIAK